MSSRRGRWTQISSWYDDQLVSFAEGITVTSHAKDVGLG
jgi:hypothetical protein